MGHFSPRSPPPTPRCRSGRTCPAAPPGRGPMTGRTPLRTAGGCSPGVDPLGYARLDPNQGSFDADRATAKAYSADATVFSYTFGGSTGFTDTIHHHYSYNNPATSSSASPGMLLVITTRPGSRSVTVIRAGSITSPPGRRPSRASPGVRPSGLAQALLLLPSAFRARSSRWRPDRTDIDHQPSYRMTASRDAGDIQDLRNRGAERPGDLLYRGIPRATRSCAPSHHRGSGLAVSIHQVAPLAW